MAVLFVAAAVAGRYDVHSTKNVKAARKVEFGDGFLCSGYLRPIRGRIAR